MFCVFGLPTYMTGAAGGWAERGNFKGEFMNHQVTKTTDALKSLVIAVVAQISLPKSKINGVSVGGDEIRHRGVAKTGRKS